MEIMHTNIRVYDETIWVVCNFPRMKSDIKKKIIVNCVKRWRGVGGGSRDNI